MLGAADRLRRYIGDAVAGNGTTGRYVLPLFLLVNSVVLYNGVFHPPTIGYDAGHHLRYIATLADFRLPTPADSPEFFSPPLAYILPALALAVADLSLAQAAKFAQLTQFLVSVALTFYLLKLCEILRPRDATFKLAALGLCGLPAVYYKTFSQVRGETWLALFAVLIAYHVLRALRAGDRGRCRGLALGGFCALALLSRQWGALLLLAIALFALLLALRRPEWRGRIMKVTGIAAVVALFGGGWFYFNLRHEYGSFSAFNRAPRALASANSARHFYLGTGGAKLFTEPVRAAFPNQLVPIFYSEIWGDYWAFFLIHGRDVVRDRCLNGPRLERALARDDPSRIETNRATMGAYLGRVNAVALLPALLLLAGVVQGGRAFMRVLSDAAADDRTVGLALSFVLVVASLGGYLWFVTQYQSPGRGLTIKATYMLQVLPLTALLGAEALIALRARWRWAFRMLIFLLVLIALHNAPTLFTRYASWMGGVCSRGRPPRGSPSPNDVSAVAPSGNIHLSGATLSRVGL